MPMATRSPSPHPARFPSARSNRRCGAGSARHHLPSPGPGVAGAGTLFGGDGQFGTDVNAPDNPYHADPATSTATPSTAGSATAATYKRYKVDLPNRSITSPEAREQVWQLLRELAKVIDNANAAADHQLLSLSLTLTTADGHQRHLVEKAHQAGARVRVEDDEF